VGSAGFRGSSRVRRDQRDQPGCGAEESRQEIDSRPVWATALDLAAAKPATGTAQVLPSRCSDQGFFVGKRWDYFVCELHYYDASGRSYLLFFHENFNGSDIAPIAYLVNSSGPSGQLELEAFRDSPQNTSAVHVDLSQFRALFGISPRPSGVTVPIPVGLTAAQRSVFTAGEYVADQSGCLACHMIGDNGNNGPGPPLTAIGSRLNARQIGTSLINPIAPMPSFRSLESQTPVKFRDLVTFLSELR
jgi:hypothetical protein